MKYLMLTMMICLACACQQQTPDLIPYRSDFFIDNQTTTELFIWNPPDLFASFKAQQSTYLGVEYGAINLEALSPIVLYKTDNGQALGFGTPVKVYEQQPFDLDAWELTKRDSLFSYTLVIREADLLR